MMSLVNGNFEGNVVRHQKVGEKLYFHLGDVCKVLDIKNSRELARKIKKVDGDAVILNDAIDSIGRTQKSNFVEEQYLYFDVIPKSRKPFARKFSTWARNVLKTVIRTGEYKVEMNKLETENKKLDFELIKFAKEHYSDNAIMMRATDEKMAKLLSGGQNLLKSRPLEPIVDILQRIGKKGY